MAKPPLFELPKHSLELLEDLTNVKDAGFLCVLRRKYQVRFSDGATSSPFVYDEVSRAALDAVVIAAHAPHASGARHVYLTSALRPPIVMREKPPPGGSAGLWELPAGLIEVTERDAGGARRAAVRELAEEIGFSVPPEKLSELGPWTYPAPAVIAERHIFFEVEVEPAERRAPAQDGPLEQGALVVDVPLETALAMCARGEIRDAKTELALRRLVERLS
jgi:ADP-ribose pyrophosphatase